MSHAIVKLIFYFPKLNVSYSYCSRVRVRYEKESQQVSIKSEIFILC